MEYNFRQLEKKWQEHWKQTGAYKVSNQSDKPKYYVLDMFPYPSGAGLHVGHPLGYIASDIFSRYKRLKGFNVLHPMGFDSFGLPAEQYAIETGQHPSVTTDKNIERYHQQLDNIGFCYDWSREVRTSDPGYYKWTQYIFLQLFDSWYNRKAAKADRIPSLLAIFETEGNTAHECPGDEAIQFTAEQWKQYSQKQQQDILMQYRLAFSAYGEVNWCEALGTVLANDEVVNGVSERGGHPVVKKKMRQWYLRITEYADRLLQGLETVEFSESMKEMQRNWIGKSMGAEIIFPLAPASPRRGVEPMQTRGQYLESLQGQGHLQATDQTIERRRSDNEPGKGYPVYSVSNAMNYEHAKEMRKEPTEAEALLWNALRANATGYKFRRQHPIENYIADFVCLDTWVIIEVDGGYHTDPNQKEKDHVRDAELKKIGFKTLRFTNEDVLNNLEAVVKQIIDTNDEIKQNVEGKKTTLSASTPQYAEGNNMADLSSPEKKSDDAGGSSPLQGEVGVRVYTTRPDTIFGVDFMVVAPEHSLVEKITSNYQRAEIETYLTYVKSRSERERMSEVKQITGAFTGAYAINPFDGRQIPIWISEYVLAGYGTGAIMAVPSGDQRDFAFAKHFNIPITNIIGEAFNGEEANPTKDATLTNSDFLNGMVMRDAIDVVIDKLEAMGIGKRKVNYRMRDAGFSRQRYWGEPFPIIYKDGIATPLTENDLPVELPYVEKYGPGPEGEGPLANLQDWVNIKSDSLSLGEGWGEVKRETNTMPGYAGSSWYFLRYMDPHNNETFVDKKIADYWGQVDLYIGGTEHAVGHLLYSRMWTKALYDLGYINHEEPFKKLLNQGMIQGASRFVFRVKGENKFVSTGLKHQYDHTDLHVDVALVDGIELDIEKFKASKPEYADTEFILEDGKYICGAEIEKMSKSKYNVVNPDDIVERYGADTFRMYEMFLGPVEQSKPWDTKGIEGVHRFLRKFWRLYIDEVKGVIVTDEPATSAELKVLHKTIKKIEEDTERFSFNTAVSAFMVCVNELNELKCHKRAVLEPLLIILTPYAPHIAEELWNQVVQEGSVLDATFPKLESQYLVESSKEYPISVNGKVRTNVSISLEATQPDVEAIVLQNEIVQKWLEGKQPKKIIYVKGKMINVVI